MKMNIFVAAAACMVGSASTANSATITNGGFVGSFTGSHLTVNAGGTAIPDWTVGGGGVDLLNTFMPSADGDGYSVDLSALTAGSVSQVISDLDVGTTYTVSFFMAAYISGNTNLDAPTKSLTVDVGGSAVTYTANSTPRLSVVWSENFFTFVASMTSQTLKLEPFEQCGWSGD